MSRADDAAGGRVLAWLHIGDLHLATAEADNHRDLRRIVALANALPLGSLDFAVLPGDNADDGTREQYALLRHAVAGLSLPLYVLPGDRDFKPGSLDALHAALGVERLPRTVRVKGHRCLFLDVVSAGTGGPDFRLDPAQLDWADRSWRPRGRPARRRWCSCTPIRRTCGKAPNAFAGCSPAPRCGAWTWATPITTSWPTMAAQSSWRRDRPGRWRKARPDSPSPPWTGPAWAGASSRSTRLGRLSSSRARRTAALSRT
jgi:hypothetical protein